MRGEVKGYWGNGAHGEPSVDGMDGANDVFHVARMGGSVKCDRISIDDVGWMPDSEGWTSSRNAIKGNERIAAAMSAGFLSADWN